MVLVGCKIEAEHQGLRTRITAHDALGVGEQRMDIDRPGNKKSKFAVPGPGEVEQVIDQSSFELDIAPHHAELPAQFGLDAGFLFESRGTHEHWSKWRSQLV